MDILNCKDNNFFLNPHLETIGNCQFRRYENTISKDDSSKKSLRPYLDNDDEMINCMELEDDMEIKLTKSGRFLTQFHVAEALFATIIGAKGTKRKEIEMDTDSQIKVPKQGETGDIIITSTSKKNVASARLRVEMIVLQARDKMQLTHFVSIPVTTEEIRHNFDIFKKSILNGPALRGIDETIFQTPEKLHLTIAPLVLLDDYEKDLAIETLHKYRDNLSELFKNSGPLEIILEGLEVMNDDPTNVDVLYGKVKLNYPKYNSQFQKMADQIVEILSKKGLIRRQYESVKLHVTLMNSMFRRRAQEQSTRQSFDASYILKQYQNFSFGATQFSGISLVVRYTTSEQDKFYERLTTINIPQ